MNLRLIMLIILFVSKLNAQCTLENLFFLKNGISKFTAINQIKLNSNLKEYDYGPMGPVNDYVDYPEYLNGVSVKRSQYLAVFNYHPCIQNWKENRIFLTFADDNLYKITLTFEFDPSNFTSLLDSYNSIIATLKKRKYFFKKMVTTEDNEQLGEGYWFNPYKGFKSKIEEIQVSYQIVYEEKWNISKQKSERTGRIKRYELIINSTNLNGTKLDNRGY